MVKGTCIKCGIEQNLYAKGKCWNCYKTDYQNNPEFRQKQNERHRSPEFKLYLKGYRKTQSYFMSMVRHFFKKLTPESKEKILLEIWK